MAYKWHSGLSPKRPPSVWGYLVQFSFELMMLFIFYVEFIDANFSIKFCLQQILGKTFFAREGGRCVGVCCVKMIYQGYKYSPRFDHFLLPISRLIPAINTSKIDGNVCIISKNCAVKKIS